MNEEEFKAWLKDLADRSGEPIVVWLSPKTYNDLVKAFGGK